MPAPRQRQNDPVSGEEFSDVSPTVDTTDDEQTQDNWIFPVVPPNSSRKLYTTVSKFHCGILLTTSEVASRLLKVRKSRLANFKMKSKGLRSKTLNYVRISEGRRMLEVPAVFFQTMISSSRSMRKSLES
jgi:hypothetical protein